LVITLLIDIKKNSSLIGLSVGLRTEAPKVWDDVLNRLSYIPFAYTNSSIEFQLAYQSGCGGMWQDISVIIYWDSKPAALWPLTLSTKNDVNYITSQGLRVQPPIYVGYLNSTTRKRITKLCFDIINGIAKELNVTSWESAEANNLRMDFSEWHIEAMLRGARSSVEHDIFIDISKSINEIKSGFRKSYKSLITSGQKNWTVEVLSSENQNIWNKFKSLHLKVAGRKTRSDETWKIHLNDIKQHQGFLVYLLNANNKMDGAGFFNFTRDEGLYSVAAYDRELFDKPLGHVVQYRAIEEFKKKGVAWYKLGARPYPTDQPSPTSKELSIASFKEGFASHNTPRFVLQHT